MKTKITVVLFLTFVLTLGQTKGTIKGTLTDKENKNAALPFANAILKGTSVGVTTDENGVYLLSAVAGTYNLQFSFIGYESIEQQVTIVAGATEIINKSLGAGGYKLQDVVIQKAATNREKETALFLDQKKAVEIKQSIGAQEMSRKGVSNVEQGLTKITGISKVGSRGIFVRGLEDRYNNLLVNELPVPSNNPFRKIIPLDLFSTDIVSVIDVYKTFNPNISGDFAGATFNIATTINSKSTTKISIGVGYTTNNNLSDFLIAKDANTTKGFLGLSEYDRARPTILGSTPSNYQLTPAEAQRSFKSGWDVSPVQSPLNTSFGVLHSQKYKFKNDKSISYLLSLNTENSYTSRSGVDNTFSNNGFYNNLSGSEFHYKTSTSALFSLNYKTQRFFITSNTFYLRSTDNMIQDQKGAFATNFDNYNVLVRTNQFDQSDYVNTQLLSDYYLNNDKSQSLRFGASFAVTAYKQPDRKFFKSGLDSNNIATISYGGNNFIRQYLDIKGNNYESGFLEYNLKFGPDKKNKVSVGYNGNQSNTETSYRFVKTNGNASFTSNVNSIDAILKTDLLSGAFNYQENSNASFKTKLAEMSNAAYLNLDFKFLKNWQVSGGIRAEKFNRELRYRFNGSFSDPFSIKKIDKTYFLPSINVKYSVNDKSNLRFAASTNYTKPVTMEVLPISYVNGDGTSVQGNAFLVNSDNLNIDFKYELFPSSKELFAVGAFVKHINNPIERTFRGEAGGSGTITTFLNSKSADLFGFEFEGVLDLNRISNHLNNFTLGFNTSLMQTKVAINPTTIDPSTGESIPSAETHFDRELQGASKWLVNSDLKYTFDFNKTWNNTASLVYSVNGKRIFTVGSNGLDHIYELPFHQLDFVWNSKIKENYNVKFGVNNILNPYRIQQIGNNSNKALVNFGPETNTDIVQQFKRGIGFSLNFSYTF